LQQAEPAEFSQPVCTKTVGLAFLATETAHSETSSDCDTVLWLQRFK